MKILSIDACTETISIALIVEKVITEKNFPSGKNYSGNILPEIKILLSESNLNNKSRSSKDILRSNSHNMSQDVTD